MLEKVFAACSRLDSVATFSNLIKLKYNDDKKLGERSLPDLISVHINIMHTEKLLIQRYSQRQKTWTSLHTIVDKRRMFSAELVDSKLYVMGGENNARVTLNTVWKMHLLLIQN